MLLVVTCDSKFHKSLTVVGVDMLDENEMVVNH